MVTFTLNGSRADAGSPPDTPLLQVLRGEFGLSGPRFGCGEEACGACAVSIDGRVAFSCTLPLSDVAGKSVVTAEGLGTAEAPHPLQSAILAEQAAQCGFCISGIMIAAAALLEREPHPEEASIRSALDPHLCRCGAHNRILRAVLRAAAADGVAG